MFAPAKRNHKDSARQILRTAGCANGYGYALLSLASFWGKGNMTVSAKLRRLGLGGAIEFAPARIYIGFF